MARKQADRDHLRDVSALGCVVCRNLGYMGKHDAVPAEIHHITTGVGMSQKATDYQTIPLCAARHRTGGWGVAVHAGEKEWEGRYGAQTALLAQVERELIEYRESIVGRSA
ncbi:MAG: Ref family recombination enhancement nuclease [Amphritea sp.]|nr:Ref family recombination enhancement nuclease [Amphritea sp.]